MDSSKHDIANIDDIQVMVDSFYEKVNKDEFLSPVFNDYAEVDWESHLPKMYTFWNKILFSQGEYKGDPFAAHVSLPIKKHHFERWIELFIQNIDELFEGNMAEEAKLRARSIAYVFQSKLKYINPGFNEP